MMIRRSLSVLVLAMAAWVAFSLPRPPDVPFVSRMIDSGIAETPALADINRDGKLDIVAGENWFEAPDWEAASLPLAQFCGWLPTMTSVMFRSM